MDLPQTAFDILMFLANNPDYKTARDIVEIRQIKANLVSVNVDKLVQEGYLERQHGGRMTAAKQELLCTGKGQTRSSRGAVPLQNAFFERLLAHTDASRCGRRFSRTMELIGKNLDEILKENA